MTSGPDGRIVATAKFSPFYVVWGTAVNLPTAAFRAGENDVEIHSIPAD